MSETIIYHNPSCSKSRTTLALLRQRGIEPEIIHYLTDVPNQAQLTTIVNCGVPIQELIRTQEELWQTLNINLETASQSDLIAVLMEHPSVMQRPVVIHLGQAIIARPPEKILEII